MGKSGGKSGGNWLMTYADFITLMMIFFIVLYTFTPGVEKNKFTAIIGAFQGKRGVLQYESVFSDESLQIDIQRAKNWDEMYQKIQNEDLQDQVEIDIIPDGVRIIMGEAALFETYSAKLLPESHDLLLDIANGIERYTLEEIDVIDIQGHTDNRAIRVSADRKYESNWELGSGRSLSVMHFLEENVSLKPEKFSIRSFGEYRPRVPNTSPENMQRNRRVEVFIRYAPVGVGKNKNTATD
jgi:chemotaxis protein MotB